MSRYEITWVRRYWAAFRLTFLLSLCLFPLTSKLQSVCQHAVMFLGQQPWIADFQPRIPGHLQHGLHFLSQLHRHLPGAARTGRPWLPEQTGLYFAGGKRLWLQAFQFNHHNPWEWGLILLRAGGRWAGGGPENTSAEAFGDPSLHELPVPAFLAVFPLSSLLAPCYWCFLLVRRGLFWPGLTVGFRSANQADGAPAWRGPAAEAAGLPRQQTRQHYGRSRVFERYIAQNVLLLIKIM